MSLIYRETLKPTYLGLKNNDEYYILPILNIEEIMRKRRWESEDISEEDIASLYLYKQFLDSAKSGKRQLEQSEMTRMLIFDLNPLECYELILDAVKHAGLSSKIDDLLNASIKVVQSIIASLIQAKKPENDETDIKNAYLLVQLIYKYIYSNI